MSDDIDLTKMQEEVAKLVGQGKFNKEIMQELGINRSTLGQHFTRIYEKMGITDSDGKKTKLAVWAWKKWFR